MEYISSLSFIGGGRISYLLLKGLKRADNLPEKIIVSDPNIERKKILKSIDASKINFSQQNSESLKSPIIFIALHPPLIKEVLPQIRHDLSPESILISLAPVVKIADLQQLSGGFKRIVRMIPNAPSIIGEGYNPVCFADSISAQEKSLLLTLFKKWGQTSEVKEDKLEAYAILTAMGPTYFWFQWLELERLGKKFNLNNEELKESLFKMILGSSQLLYNSEYTREDILDMIPVRPLQEEEESIRSIFNNRLSGLYAKLTAKR